MSTPAPRVRFAPSPTGYLHIGGARTVLFNWLLARQSGGALILRIEDTDQARNVEDSVGKILDDLRWLGLGWDEGPQAGGDVGPYFQSRRLDIYQKYIDRLLAERQAYYALESPDELAAMRDEARAQKRDWKYPRPDPLPTIEQGVAARQAGKHVTVRFKTPREDITVHDAILGDVRLSSDEIDDLVIQKSDGWPTYHFACVVDDELMGITHVLRGQEHLINTPKHVAMQRVLGFRTPVYAHLPIIFNMNGSKMSKRDKEKAIAKGVAPPEIDVHDFRTAGYLPEAVLNFISLLGWSAGDDIEQRSLEETARKFSLDRVGKTGAKFDRDKLIAFNTDWVARVDEKRLLEAARDFAVTSGSPLNRADDATLAELLRLCRGFRTFRDVEQKTAFLFVEDDQLVFNEKAVKKVLAKNDGAGFSMLEKLLPQLEALDPWTAAAAESLLNDLCEQWNVKLGAVAQPIRVALTGNTVSPPIGDTIALLGAVRTKHRIQQAIALRQDRVQS